MYNKIKYMERINVAELLKNCPSGMELDCIMFEGSVIFEDISEDDEYPIGISTKNGEYTNLTKYGQYLDLEEAKCVIFPKDKTTWEGFVPPCNFKNGDILFVDCSDDNNKNHQYIFILNRIYNSEVHSYCHYRMCGVFHPKTEYLTGDEFPIRLATKEEKEKLFDAIKANGYKWNPETMTLEEVSEPKFKDGDIVALDYTDGTQLFIFKEYIRHDYVTCYIALGCDGETDFEGGDYYVERLATEEEKQKLFQVIKDNGYEWNAKTKTLENLIEPLIEPEFKVGDKIRHKHDKTIIKTISYIYYDSYALCDNQILLFEEQNDWELVPDKFDINTLVPFESRVLVRDSNKKWRPAIYGFCDKFEIRCAFYVVGGSVFEQCIPYEGNEHLLSKTDDCDEFYRTWEKTGN